MEFTNTGQSIWDRQNFELQVTSNLPDDSVFAGHVGGTEPGQSVRVDLDLKTGTAAGPINLQLQLAFADKPFGESITKTIRIVPPPEVVLSARPLVKIGYPTTNQSRLLVYDADNYLLQENQVELRQGRSESIKLYNLVPDQSYRLVLLKPYYLPRQTWIRLSSGENQVSFKPLLPLDFNQDGRLSPADFWAWLLFPINYFRFALQPGN